MAGAEQLEDEEPRQQEVVHNHPDLGPRAGRGRGRGGEARQWNYCAGNLPLTSATAMEHLNCQIVQYCMANGYAIKCKQTNLIGVKRSRLSQLTLSSSLIIIQYYGMYIFQYHGSNM